MLKEKNQILKLKLKNENMLITNLLNNFFEGFYALYDFLLQAPIENFWYECISILLSYFQLISLVFTENVSLIIKYIKL